MKRLLRQTISLLRTAMLFAAIALIIPTQAQTAGLPDAFETMDPATIIGDGNYYYIQFYDGNIRSYLTDCGVDKNAWTKDFLPYANNRLWTLEAAGDGNATHFKLRNRDGHYIKYGTSENSARLGCVEGSANATVLVYTSLGGDGYDISQVGNEDYPFYRPGSAEWTPIAQHSQTRRASNYYVCRLRFVKLKSNSAFIIYYRREGTDNSNPSAATTRHYLTYSGTAASSLGDNWWWSNVSSRQSIIPSDKPLCSLPTIAAYHKDGLWTFEKADVEGQFYIKKYGTDQYLNEDQHGNVYGSELGNKDAIKGTYTLESPLANRYSRVQNVKYETTNLTADMFNTWDGYDANATSTGSANLSLNYGTQESSLNGGILVAGTGGVLCQTYADLSIYQKMTINGTPNMQLRVLMDRQEHDSGPYVEKNVTIGSDGTAVVDLTDLEINRKYSWPTVSMTYVDANATEPVGGVAWGEPAKSGYNNISGGAVGLENSGWGVNYLTYLKVDASAIQGTILKATLKAKVSGSLDDRRKTRWGVGYNSSEWSSGLTWNNADKSITTIGDAKWVNSTTNSQTYEDITFDITQALSADADKIMTLLVYELEAGGGNFKEPVLEIQYEPTVKDKIPYAHLNAIKRDYGGVAGTISSITLSSISNQNTRYLHHAHGDGWQVMQWSGDDPDYWNAGFYPVEVVDKDEFYQVLLKSGDQMVGVSNDSKAVLKTYNDFNPELWTLEQFSDYEHFRLQSWKGGYYSQLTEPLVTNPPTSGNGVFTNNDINSLFTIQWLPKTETRIMHDVTHKVSNVKLYYAYNYTTPEKQKLYSQQGLITDAYSDWWNYDTGTQKVNEFEITHYVKKGETVTFGLPTVLTYHNDHILYQRWYKYGDDRNLEDLKNHFRLKVDDAEVMGYLYNNGIVTGDKLDWPTVFPGARTCVLNYLSFNNCDGQPFTLAADVSRYSDFTYKNASSHLDGDLEETSLTMRYIYHMRDAKEMATNLWNCPYNSDGNGNWLEKKTFHFPAKRLAYETSKQEEYQGEFIGIRYQFKDYWVFNDNVHDDDHLVSAVTDNTSGKIEVVVEDGGTGITLGGHKVNGVYQGYYYYDEGNKRSGAYRTYGDSRFVVFRYPGETVTHSGENYKACIKVYFNNGGTRYQIAKFEIIFDDDTSTLPWDDTDATKRVKGSNRDPKELEKKAGKPIAKISFDYPKGATFKNCSKYYIHNMTVYDNMEWEPIANSSPLPLTFDKTNYGFDGDNPSWGSYAMVSTMNTVNGNRKTALPVNHSTQGYNIAADEGMEAAFLYIDASEQPGEICSVPFTGEFCSDDLLMCSGWISGSNKIADATNYRCPGSVILTVKGQNTGEDDETIYRFCPGQCYELDNGDYVNWQQFYFEFKVNKKYEKYWVEVNNNCVSSTGGDFMLDNIEVYAFVPEATPEMNTPICINKDASEMQLLKISVGFDKLLSAVGATEVTGDASVDRTYAFLFLEKDVFLTKFQEELANLSINKTKAELEAIIQSGEYGDLVMTTYATAYRNAFNAAVLGDRTKIWDSNNPTVYTDAAVLNFHWNTNFSKMDTYTFVKAVNKLGAVFGETDSESGERLVVMNGNYPNQLSWKVNTDYYIVPYNTGVTNLNTIYEDFNICSICSKKKVFQIKPPLNILSMETSDVTQELEVCEGKIPTLLTDLKGMTINGVEVPLKDLNFDWWLGDLTSNPKVLATLENYHSQTNTAGTVRLDVALPTLRVYYPGITSLDGIKERLSETPYLTLEMIYYLQELVDKGQLILHQKSISIPAEKVSADDPYCYLVACPIHDYYFDQALNLDGADDVAYFCDEPQGLRLKVGEKAPSLKCGFVPNENGYSTYNYPDGNLILSIRLAKKAQFETVQHGTANETPLEWESSSNVNFLWLPIRDAQVQSTSSSKVIRKSDDYNIYLSSTDDPEWDKSIYNGMRTNGLLPIVGKIVKLNAIDKDKNTGTEKDENRLCIYFTDNFDVREGYNYTLSLPFKEDGDANTCDGTILLHLKIVPDYEVWTGAAGSTDWNNDQNWRRADGNLGTSTEEPSDGAGLNNNELLVSASLPSTSPLKGYTTNFTNYRSAKDRLLRKGFAPLYCTHILLKSNEWGDAPVLYDALNGKDALDAAPFPNLSETYVVNTVEYSIGEGDRYTSIAAIGNNSFAIVNETDSKAFYGSNAQNLGFGSYEAAMQYTNSGFYFKLAPASGVDGYYLKLQTPAGQDYWVWGSQGYLNSQPASGNLSFILGLNNQNGQDIQNGAVWTIEENGGKFALKNVGTGKYLKDASSAKYDTPTYFTFCKLQGKTVSSSSNVRANTLKYDMQAREYSIWTGTYKDAPDKGRNGDLIAEMYQVNSCDEIAFQPTAELLNAHLLNYNNAWMEYQLDMNRWYLLGSALQGTISGEWYAPTGTAQQKTTYYEDVKFGTGYDRYSPAIYQRSWDKAKAVLYEVDSQYDITNDPDDSQLGSAKQGIWSGTSWNDTGADDYLDRLGYKPLGNKKANVAIKGVWSNTYNDATVDYSKGAFSVLVKNDLKGGSNADPAIIRLPKEDTMYDYYEFAQTGANDGGTDTNLSDVRTLNRAKNRGRLKTDLLLPTSDSSLPLYQKIQRTETAVSRYGDQRTYTRVPTQVGANALPMTLQNISESVSPGVSNLGYYLVENPFPCGLNMDEFFNANSGLQKKYWLLTTADAGQSPRQQLVQQAPTGEWISSDGSSFAATEAKVAPGQGFFVQTKTGATDANNIQFTSNMQAQTRYGKKSNEGTTFRIVVGTKVKMSEANPEEPVLDANGDYILEDVTEDVVIYNYVQDTGNGKVFPLKSRTRSDENESSLGLVITAQRGDDESSALVMQSSEASNDFLPEEDTETFINSDLVNVPTVYTLCGRLATTINSIHDFRSLSIGVESDSDAPCVLTFQGVELLGDSISFYDAVEQKLAPLESGMQFRVSGQTQNRYYLVRSLDLEEAAQETHLQIFTEGRTVKVIASTEEPIVSVRCFDTGGRLIYSVSPQRKEYEFSLPNAGVYIIEARTEKDRKTKKVMTK